jgi:sulfatase maturation enzyme AslB (radical SAM superfamily)
MDVRGAARTVALQFPPLRRLYDHARFLQDRAKSLEDDARSLQHRTTSLEDHVRSLEDRATSLQNRATSLQEDLAVSEARRRGEAPINYNFRKLHLLITNRCDFTCVMCAIIHGNKSTLSEATVRGLIEDADALDFDQVEISGGEPYYVPYFKSVIEDYGGKIKPMLKICTNAYSLEPPLINRLAGRKRLHFQVSFDGTGAVHNAIRVQNRYDAFSRSESNFRALADAGLAVSLNTVIQRHNVGNLLATYRHFRDVPYLFHGFGLVELDSWDYAKNCLLPEQIEPLASELEALIAEAKADEQQVGIDSNMVAHIRSMATSSASAAADFPMHAGYGCTVPFSHVIVDTRGAIYPCIHGDWGDRNAFNVHQGRLAEILFSSTYIERSRHAVRIDGCSGCSTACYFHDPVFRRKCMHPTAFDIAQRDAQRDFLRHQKSPQVEMRSA